jgi:hypothetical protein
MKAVVAVGQLLYTLVAIFAFLAIVRLVRGIVRSLWYECFPRFPQVHHLIWASNDPVLVEFDHHACFNHSRP